MEYEAPISACRLDLSLTNSGGSAPRPRQGKDKAPISQRAMRQPTTTFISCTGTLEQRCFVTIDHVSSYDCCHAPIQS